MGNASYAPQLVARIRELSAKAQAKGEGCLDEAVHDLKSKEASAINNGGVSEQVAYIQESCGMEETVRLLEEATK
jgi:hypothetical protein